MRPVPRSETKNLCLWAGEHSVPEWHSASARRRSRRQARTKGTFRTSIDEPGSAPSASPRGISGGDPFRVRMTLYMIGEDTLGTRLIACRLDERARHYLKGSYARRERSESCLLPCCYQLTTEPQASAPASSI